jgi:nucleotide-binding universal stress UspA family protein
MFTSIVVALDLGAGGDRALPVVRALSALADIPVELLTVSSPHIDEEVDAYELRRRELANNWPAHAYTIVHDNDPARAIVEHVSARNEALLVMATTAKPPVVGHLLGSVSEDVLSRIEQPLLLVGPHVPSTFEMTRPTLIACIDGSDVAEAAVPVIAAWTRTFGGADPWIAEMLPASGRGVPDVPESAHARHYAARLATEGISTSWEVLHGSDPEVGLDEFADRVVDPIFVATSVRWTDHRSHWRSTTRRLVHRSTRPVLVVPARGPGAAHGARPGGRAGLTREVASATVTAPGDAGSRGPEAPADRSREDPFAVEELTPAACWELLGSIRVGRIAVCMDGSPRIFPINFVVDRETVVFRTAPGTKLSAARNAEVAFEVDDYDATSGHASSVIITGRATEVTDADDWDYTLGLPLFPWHLGPKAHFVRITPDEITGRRFRAPYAGPDG